MSAFCCSAIAGVLIFSTQMDSPAHPISANSSLSIQQVAGYSQERLELERSLTDRGVVSPVPQRANWQRANGYADTVLVVVRDQATNAPVGVIGAGITMSRALPGHRIYRVERLGSCGSERADREMLGALTTLARRDPVCLRLVVEVFERNPDARLRLCRRLVKLGFTRSPSPRNYQNTLALDLQRSTDEIFAGLHRTARRHIRAPGKRGLELHPIVDPSFAPRLEALIRETYDRTDTPPDPKPWHRIIELSAANPSVSRIIGLFDGHGRAPENLVAFAWGCAHGPHVTYEAGASCRRPELGSTSLGYAPLWDLITWAREHTAATWFDLGGAKGGVDPHGDELDGIYEFKRYFSRESVDVGDEWVMEPLRGRAAIARVISAAATWVLRLRPPKIKWVALIAAEGVDVNSIATSMLTVQDSARSFL
jgi:hypothetical protein